MEEQLNEALAQVAAEQLRADTAEQSHKEAETKIASLEGELRGVQNELNTIKKERTDVDVDKLKSENKTLRSQLQTVTKARTDEQKAFPKKLEEAVQERVELISQAQSVLGDEVKFDELSNREIRVKVIERLDGPVDESKPEAYINGCFKTLVKGHTLGSAAIARTREAAAEIASRADSGKAKPNLTPRKKFLEDQENAWK